MNDMNQFFPSIDQMIYAKRLCASQKAIIFVKY